MSSDIVKGMARMYFETEFADGWSYAEMEEKVPGHNANMEHSMRAALLWLAESLESKGKHFVAGEIRAAAEGEGT